MMQNWRRIYFPQWMRFGRHNNLKKDIRKQRQSDIGTASAVFLSHRFQTDYKQNTHRFVFYNFKMMDLYEGYKRVTVYCSGYLITTPAEWRAPDAFLLLCIVPALP